MRKHTMIQLALLLVLLILATPLAVLFALRPQMLSQPEARATTTLRATPTAIPTAHVISTPSVSPEVVVPTPSPTAPPVQTTEATTSTATIAARGPVVREGPGGLPYPLRLAQPNYGAVGHFYYTDRATAFTTARQAGFQWIRQQVHWRDIEDKSGAMYWDEVDKIVEEANSYGLLVLLSVVRSPEWYTADGSDGMPDDPATLARFMSAMAARYSGRVHAIEVWNEQNLAHENGGRISLDDAGDYVEMLAASYEAIKAVDPGIIVVAGAPSPTATDVATVAVPDIPYMQAMYSYKNGMMRDYFDVQALHPIGTINPPDKLWPDDPNSEAVGWNDNEIFYFRHIEHARQVMEAAGLGHHQVWVTEFGWATANNTPGYEYGNYISFETQRDYIVAAMERSDEQYPWVSNMFVWNLNFTVVQREAGVDPLHEQGSFSIVNEDWTPRPAYYGIQEFIRQRQMARGN